MNMYYRRNTKRDKMKNWYDLWKPAVWIFTTVIIMAVLAAVADAQEHNTVDADAELKIVDTGIKCAGFFTMVARDRSTRITDDDKKIYEFAVISTNVSLFSAVRHGENINIAQEQVVEAYEAEVTKLQQTPQVEANQIIAVARTLCKSYVITAVDEFGEELGLEIIQE